MDRPGTCSSGGLPHDFSSDREPGTPAQSPPAAHLLRSLRDRRGGDRTVPGDRDDPTGHGRQPRADRAGSLLGVFVGGFWLLPFGGAGAGGGLRERRETGGGHWA